MIAGLDKYGPLGVAETPSDDQTRLASLAELMRAPVAAGELVLHPDLHPDKLAAHAKHHLAIQSEAGTAVAGQQIDSEDLAAARKATAKALGRVKKFISAQDERALTPFGFGLPAPSTRPRLVRLEPPAPPPPVEPPK